MPIGRLAHVLRGLNSSGDRGPSRLLIGPETFADAGVVRIGDGESASTPLLVQTVDFFPPVVDDPYLYGAIAAANSLSDVYAMGASALSALNIASFPKDFSDDWIGEILRGGFDKVAEAGAVVAGGHTVEGEILFGFAITGLVMEAQMIDNAHARPGDRLYLTKRLGMGTMTTASKQGRIPFDVLRPAALQMATLNRAGCEAMLAARASAATDVTGFGLLGHARNVARASGVTLALDAASLPLWPGALDWAAQGVASGGSKRNRAELQSDVRVEPTVAEALVALAFDSETSGGLLIAVPKERAAQLEHELAARDVLVAPIGEVVPKAATSVHLR
ncbi:MAG: selenide, water dikinase SelD [Planctomycetaceae bacterium]|nr:selenide, water dikinase SelD [Planctomycetaceae bacterium]